MASDKRDKRIPYCLGTDQYCEFEDRDEYVHMGDLVVVCTNTYSGRSFTSFGYLRGVNYDYDGFISEVTLYTLDESGYFCVACDGVFYHATKLEEHND